MNNIVLVTILQAVCCLLVQALNLKMNYCDKALCTIGNIYLGEHIGCNAVNKESLTCGPNYQYINLEPYKNYIVERHNVYRNMIAGGELTRFRSAVRMAKMGWDKELAKLAKLNAIKCQLKHDQCRNTKKYKLAGQNIYIGRNDDQEKLDVETFIYGAVEKWFNEHVNSTQDQIEKYYDMAKITGDKYRITGHFTQIVNDKSTKIGCAAVTFGPKEWKYNNFLVCNYARTNLLEYPVYVAGKVGSKCRNGKDSKFKALCAVFEPINPNDFSKQ